MFLACSEQPPQPQPTPESQLNPPSAEKINASQINATKIVPSPFPTITPLVNIERNTETSSSNSNVNTISELIPPAKDKPIKSRPGKKGGSLKLASKDYFG